MDKTQTYIQNLKMEEVPWNRLGTAYGRASAFPKYFDTIWAMADLASVETALDEIMSDTEHQSTLWHSTPFAMIFLVRSFEHAIPEIGKNKCADCIIADLLDFFETIAECYFDYKEMAGENMESEELLPNFSDMLLEEYLWPEVSQEEEEEEDEEDYFFSDDLWDSIYYYSFQALLQCKPLLEKLENTSFQAWAEEIKKLLEDKDK